MQLTVQIQAGQQCEVQGLKTNVLYGWCCDGDNKPDKIIVRGGVVSPNDNIFGESILGGSYPYLPFTPVTAGAYYFDFHNIGLFADRIRNRFKIRLHVVQ